MSRSCKATKKTGDPCGMPPLEGSDYCWAHDDETATARAHARKLGGRNRRTPKSSSSGGDASGPRPRYRTVPAIQGLVERAIADTILQENSAARSRTLATLAGVALRTVEVGELEERLAALERRLGGQGPRVA